MTAKACWRFSAIKYNEFISFSALDSFWVEQILGFITNFLD